MQVGKPEWLFEERRRPRRLVREEIPPGQGDGGDPARRAASAQAHRFFAAQYQIGDKDIDRRSREPNLGLDNILAGDDVVAELCENTRDELANCSIGLGQENARHRLLRSDEFTLRTSNLVWFKNA